MKLSEYKSLLDLNILLLTAAKDYYILAGIPFDTVVVRDTQGTFVVVSRMYESREYLQSLSIWSLIEDPEAGGCSACKKSKRN